MRIKEIIQEVEQIKLSKAKGTLDTGIYTEKDIIKYRQAKQISTITTGQQVFKGTDKSGSTYYYAVSPDTTRIEISVRGIEKNNVLSKIYLQANKGNTLTAADFYHWLIVKHNLTLVADMQTSGGHNVWKALQRDHRDVNIHGWLRGKPVNINMKDDEYTHGPGYYKDEKVPQELKDASDMLLVAHKK